MKKPKIKFEVFLCEQIIDTDSGNSLSDVHKVHLGDTFAVSEKQAMNNVRYRYKDEQNPNGGYAIQCKDYGYCETRRTWFECHQA